MESATRRPRPRENRGVQRARFTRVRYPVTLLSPVCCGPLWSAPLAAMGFDTRVKCFKSLMKSLLKISLDEFSILWMLSLLFFSQHSPVCLSVSVCALSTSNKHIQPSGARIRQQPALALHDHVARAAPRDMSPKCSTIYRTSRARSPLCLFVGYYVVLLLCFS